MSLEEWLNMYGENHVHQMSQKIHKIFVPLIMWSIMALTYVIPTLKLGSLNLGLFHFLIFGSLYFYYKLGRDVAMVMLTMMSFLFLLVLLVEQTGFLWQIAATLFIISWSFQFYGHKIEGKKPSFMNDLKFLLIGPLWVMRYLKVL